MSRQLMWAKLSAEITTALRTKEFVEEHKYLRVDLCNTADFVANLAEIPVVPVNVNRPWDTVREKPMVATEKPRFRWW